MSKRLLMIAYHFPPVKMVSALRLRNIYLGFRRHWKEVEVLTSANRRLFEQDEGMAVDARVHEAPAWDLRRFLALRSRSGRSYRSAEQKASRLSQYVRRLIDSFPFNVLLSFGGPLYLWWGYRRACRLVRERNITHLFTSYRPYADHLIAYWLKCRYPHLFWIADFRDLPVDAHRHNTFLPALQHRINRFILTRADLLSTVSEGLARELRHYHDDVYVLRNGIDPSLPAPDWISKNILGSAKILQGAPDLPVFGKLASLSNAEIPGLNLENQSGAVKEGGDHFTIAYTGSLYPGLQSARALLTVINRLIRRGVIQSHCLQLEYAGKDGDTWRRWIQQADLEANSIDHGLLPWCKAVQLQRNAQINLLLSWAAPGYSGILTAKFYDYLAARRPILVLIEGVKDEEWQSICDDISGCRLFYPHRQPLNQLEAYLLHQYQAWQRGEAVSRPASYELYPHTWPVLMEGFIDHLEIKQMR